MADVRLFIVTDDPRQAVRDVLGVSTLLEVPDFVRVVSAPMQIATLPDGARGIGRWYGAHRSMAEFAWMDRRARGGVSGVSAAFQDRLNEWKAARRAEETALLRQILAEEASSHLAVVEPATAPETKPRQKWS